MIKLLVILIAFVGFPLSADAQNPYLPLWEFIPDGEPYVFEDPDNPGKYRVYVYGSHDNLITEYCGRDQVVWSAPVEDLKNWRYHGIIFELKKDAHGRMLHDDGRGDVLYAPDVVEVKDAKGKKTYYLYPNVQDQNRNGIIAKASRPDGPFVVCNWNPRGLAESVGPFGFDPAAFVDDDGRAYGYWGFKRSYAAELDPKTMCTVKPGTQIIQDMIPGYEMDKKFRFFEASSIRKIKDKYVFIYSRWTNDGEFGLWESNYTLAYCYSNHPLGPWTYGGTIIDGRARKRTMHGTTIATACPNGNTHGSICEINGKWWVFYHRQASNNEYSRQAMVAPIHVEVHEGPDGFVHIGEAEYTSEGFMTEGLDPFTRYPAGIACYYTGPEPAYAEYPYVRYSGSYPDIIRMKYDGKKNPYDPSINISPMVNNTSGSVVGYKYFNFSKTFGKDGLRISVNYNPASVAGTMDIFIDHPTAEEGGVKVGMMNIRAGSRAKVIEATASVETLKKYNGKHALYFVFNSQVKHNSICTLNSFVFTK